MTMFSPLTQPLHKTERQFRNCPITNWKIQILLIEDSVQGCCLQTKCHFTKHSLCLLNGKDAVGQERLYLGALAVRILHKTNRYFTVEVLESNGHWGKSKGDVFQTHPVNLWRITK